MSLINVLVVKASRDVRVAIAAAIATSVAARTDMELVEGSSADDTRCVQVDDLETILGSIDPSSRCALVLVGRSADTSELARRCLTLRADLAIMYVDVVDDMVRIALRTSNLDSLLTALRDLVEDAVTHKRERVTRIPLRPVEALPESGDPAVQNSKGLLEASIKWVHALLTNAVEQAPDEVNALTVTRKSLLEQMEEPLVFPETKPPEFPEPLKQFDQELDAALKKADISNEPLAIAFRVFGLGPNAFRLMILALAPELDIRYQRCIGFLLDEAGRHVGTPSLYGSLLQISATERDELMLCINHFPRGN